MLLTGGVEPFWKPGRPAVTTQRKARFAFVYFVVDLFGVIYCLRNIFDRRLTLTDLKHSLGGVSSVGLWAPKTIYLRMLAIWWEHQNNYCKLNPQVCQWKHTNQSMKSDPLCIMHLSIMHCNNCHKNLISYGDIQKQMWSQSNICKLWKFRRKSGPQMFLVKSYWTHSLKSLFMHEDISYIKYQGKP